MGLLSKSAKFEFELVLEEEPVGGKPNGSILTAEAADLVEFNEPKSTRKPEEVSSGVKAFWVVCTCKT